MNVEKLGLPVNSRKRSIGRDFTSADGDPLRGQSPQIYENASNTMRVNSCVTEMCEPRPGTLSRSCSPGTTIPNHALPGLNSIGFWDSTGRQNWGLEARRNDGLALYFVETGNMVFMADDRRYSLRAGNFGIARPWQLHQLGDPYIGPGRVHWLAVDVGARTPNCQWRWPDWVSLTQADLAELTQKLCHNKMPVCRGTPEIGGIFRQVAKSVVHWGERHSISRMIANLNQLFVNLLETTMTQAPNKSSSQDSSRRAVELFLKSLEESPADCDDIKTLEQMSERCGMGITSFARYTRELVNLGPIEYLKQCRLDHAARQLREKPGLSVTDVAFANGFNSSQYFATCFRKQFKMSPSEFAASNPMSVA